MLGEALATDGLWLLALAALLAGVVRGFSGFGTAMVYLPFAGQLLPPVWTLATLLVIDLFGPVPALPRALRDGHPRDVLRLSAGAFIGLFLGTLLLTAMRPDLFRYAVSLISLVLLPLMIGGVRYRGAVSRKALYAIGAFGGALGGAAGLSGPPVILFYMARPLSPEVIRANTMIFLVATDIMLFAIFGARGLLDWTPLLIGAILTPGYLGAIWLGSAIFDPKREKAYRWVAYAIIAGSALGGLPVWG